MGRMISVSNMTTAWTPDRTQLKILTIVKVDEPFLRDFDKNFNILF
jgi:hypothetical protein